MNEIRPCRGHDISDGAFDDTVLMMGADAAVLDTLGLLVHSGNKILGDESSIVGLISIDRDAESPCRAFKSSLGFERILGAGTILEVTKNETRAVVDEKSNELDGILGLAILTRTAWQSTLELVDGDTLARD